MLMLLGLLVALTAVSFLAPGNANRSSVYPDISSRHNLEYALPETALQVARFIARFGSYPALWVAVIGAWWWGAPVSPQALIPKGRPVHRAAVLLALVAVA